MSASAVSADRDRPAATPHDRYRPFPPIDLPDRTWPAQAITTAPIWCSVDLRDGNQALIEPMDAARKRRMFTALVDMGFKEIEVGFPSASQTDFDFTRELIETGMIPDDVTIQVLTQSREHLIRRTFDAIAGAKRAIVHLYNSTSTTQRRVVFGLDRAGIVDIAVEGTKLVKELAAQSDVEIVFQYSPESFTQTEMDYAVDICTAVMEVWQPTVANKAIVNLPATVEVSTPNVHADQIEWFKRNFAFADRTILSVHPHNDRGTAIAAAELAQMAGAERVEGTLFGNGERTGNVDLVTMALNLTTQGIDSGLVIDDIDALKAVYEDCNQLPIHPRHPYVGELAFTAFSGSHQDAINKGIKALSQVNDGSWDVPYLPIDPKDVGRTYQGLIRINSQSGKGGIAYVLQTEYGLDLPRKLQIEFSHVVQQMTDASSAEMSSAQIWDAFRTAYLEPARPLTFLRHRTSQDAHASDVYEIAAEIVWEGTERTITGRGNGILSAFVNALKTELGVAITVLGYSEHSTGRDEAAKAAAFVEVAPADGPLGAALHGVGLHTNTSTAPLMAIASAVNRLQGR